MPADFAPVVRLGNRLRRIPVSRIGATSGVVVFVVYVVVGFGLLRLSRWAVELMATRFLSLNRMLAWTCPWSWSGHFSAYLAGTPLKGCKPHRGELDLDLGVRDKLRLIVVFSLGARILFLVALIGATYVGFGLVLVPLEVLQTWGGPDADNTIVFDTTVFNRRITLTVEHLAVSALVATLSGLSVAASAVSDEAHVKDFTQRLHRELRKNLVVARTYRGLLGAGN